MYCPNCGHKLPDEAKFCTNCGTEIDTKAKTTMRQQGLKYQKNRVDINGNKIDRNDHEQDERAVQTKGRGLFIVLCVAVVLLAAGIVWEIASLVQINHNVNTFTLPKTQTESEETENNSVTLNSGENKIGIKLE